MITVELKKNEQSLIEEPPSSILPPNGVSKASLVHRPVLVKEVMEFLKPSKGGIYLDATVGMGGHAAYILKAIEEEGLLVCADRDEDALKVSMERLKTKNAIFVKASFSELSKKLNDLGISELDGALFDLGVSLYQLKRDERGFGLFSSGRLDMRMDRSGRLTAWDVVNTYPEEKLLKIIREYGEEPRARLITKAIVRQREKRPVNTPGELAELIEKVIGRRGRIHPATRTFQAIRIEVNNELIEIEKGISTVFEMLKKGGRLCVISYHSLEDRIIKHFMKKMVLNKKAELLTKKPITPSDDELKTNPSSRSAKLRGVRRI
jgi:16S rRNA (cytosine1402-N4)-methyltransferase